MSKSVKKHKIYFEEEDFLDEEEFRKLEQTKRRKKLTDEELLELMMNQGFGG